MAGMFTVFFIPFLQHVAEWLNAHMSAREAGFCVWTVVTSHGRAWLELVWS